MAASPIPKDIARQLCEQIRAENQWYTFGGLMCLGCTTFGKDNRCVSSRPDYRGCVQVNRRYDRQQPGKAQDI